MPIYTVDIPGKGEFDVDSPVELTDEQAYAAVQSQAFAPTTRKEGTAGIGEAFMGGLKGLASSSLTAVQAPFIGGEDAALKGIERGEQMTERPGASLDAVKQAYKKDGIFSAAGEALSQIPGALAEQSPFIGAMFAGARLGAAAGPYGALAGSLLAPFLMSSGAAMERKATEQLSKGKKVDINELGAYGTGLASAGMERVALGLSGVSKMLGINILQPVTRSAEQIARQNLAATLAKGGGKLIAAEVPTEIAQQMLERYYADLPLLDEEAKKEYAEAGFGAALLAPLGMAGSFKERRGAQKEIQTQEDDLNRILTEKKQTEEAEIKAREEREEITKKQADAERQQAELIRQQEKEIIDAALKEAEETGQPLKPVQELINDLTNLGQTNPKTGLPLRKNRPLSKKELEQKKADFKAALAAPSGQFTSADIDPETGQPTFVERELTGAEARGIPIVKGYPFPPKPKPIDFDAPITKALYKTLGVGFTANVIKETEGLDPLVLEDNVKIRTAIEKHLNRPKTEDDAPPSVKLREYLETIPSLEQLENEQETRLVRNYDERTGGSASLPGESADPDAVVFQQDDRGAILEPPRYLGESQRGEDARDAALAEKEAAENLAAVEKKLSKETNLLTTLRKQGVDRNELSEITGENKLQKRGYPTGAIFKVGAKPLIDSLNDGVFNAYLPPDLQIGDESTYGQLDEKAGKAYEYITDLIRSGAVNVKPYAAQQEVDLLSDQVAQMKGSPVFYKTEAATGKPTNENTPIPQTLIDAHKEKTSDPTSYYREIEKYIGPNFKDKTLSDLENILDERVRSLPQDLRYVVSGNIKGTDVETVWQEGIASKQKAEEVAKNLEQQGKATNTRVEEYDLKIGPMGITKQAQTEAAPTQEQRVRQTLEESDTPLSIKQIAEQTDILEPNVRRITGQGAKAGKFERVDKGVYTLTTPDGKKIAHIEVGDAVNVLPKLVEQGEKFDMIFLDPAYFSNALIGGNRGIKDYEFMRAPEFKKAMESIPDLIKSNDGHVYLMLSGAPSAQQDMLPYLNAMNEVGLKVVGEGEYKKLFKNGKPVTNVRGKEASAEKIFLFTKSGKARTGEKTLNNLNFRFVRPAVRQSYSTEKAPELLNALIRNSTFEGESVLDPSAGSGVAGAEAIKAGRQATLVEKSERAVEDYIIPRIEGTQDNIQESRTDTEGVVPTFEGKEIPQSLIDAYIKSETATDRAETDASFNFGQIRSAATRLRFKLEEKMEDFLGLTFEQYQTEIEKSSDQNRVGKLRRALDNILGGKPVGYDYFASPIIKMSRKNVENTVNYKIDRSLIDKARKNNLLRESGRGSYLETKDIQESRTDTEGKGQTAETVTTELVEEFGNNINKAIQKGMLVIVDDVSQLPSNVTMSPTANGAFDPTSGISYLIANRIGQGRARRVLLHEIGEHYGLEGMLGKDYEPTLNRLNKLKDTDETVGRIWESVTQKYPDLTVGSKPFLQEVMAKIGEDAPNNSIFRRVVSLVKEFLRKLGFINVNSLTKADLQDMVLNSLNVSLADIRSTSRTTTGTLALQMSKEEGPGAFEAAQEAATRLLGLPPDNTAMDRARAMGFDDTTYYHGTDADFISFKVTEGARNSNAYVSASPDPRVANHFAKLAGKYPTGAQVYPIKIRGNIFDIKNKQHMKDLRSTAVEEVLDSGGDLDLLFANLEEMDEGNTNWKVIEQPRIQKAMRKLGFDGFRSSELGNDVENIGIFNPANIRSINAAFNPESATSPNLQFSIPDGYDSTAIFAPPNNANSKTFFNKFIDTFESFKNTPKDSLLGLFEKGGSAYTSTRINLAGTASGVEEKLGKEWTGAIEDGITENVRADIVLNQALASDTMAAQAAEEGTVILLSNGLAKVEKSEYNINRVLSIRDEIGKQSTPEVARHVTQAYLIARRYELVLKLIEKKRNNLETLKENIKKEKSIVKTSTKDDKKEAQKRLTRYEKQLARDVHFIESRTKRDAEGEVMWIAVSPEQQNAIAPGLALAQQHPQLIEMGEVIDGINENRINLMESSGIYSKDLADYYREQKGYVPLFRNMNEELTELDNANPGVKSHFNGFADVGKEYGFTGSEKVVDDVVGNILKQHFFSVNAAVRNNANRVTGEMVGVRDQDGEGEVVYSVKKPEGAAGNVSAPVFIDGERLYVEYPDPNIAVAIQGALPVYDGILGFFGKFSKIFRLGITSNPIFQTYQVANDAIGASLYSGVRNPLDLSKRIIAGFYKNQSFTGGNTDAIDAQMKRLGIAGGFGSTSEEIQRTASRKLGVENATKIESLYESVDKFASKSDIAQRRGIFEQTLIETGGTLQADGSIVGGNEVLAMNRALNIINWQKRGAATWVRKLTHVVPFLNAYLQGMDVLINALRGKGLTGEDAKLARALLYRNAASLLMLNLLYSLAVSGSDDYEEQDDRIKFRNYIIPGTGFKLPIRAELSLLIKYIPEQTALMISQYGREGAIDMAKVSDATLTAIADAGLSPNIFPQLIRGTVEGVTNYNFYTDRPLVGTGLSRLATEEQYTEGTSELAKLIGQSGLMSPIKFDHIFKAYTGTIGATGLYAIDQVSNVFLDNKRPSPTLKNFPMLSPLIYNEQGRDAINDFYDLKEESDEVAATLNRLLKFNPEKAREYRADNRKIIGARKQINKLTTRLRDIRTTRKRILASNISASDKRSRIERLDKQAHNVARNISKIRIRVNEDL